MKLDPAVALEEISRKIEEFLQQLTSTLAEKPTIIVIGGMAIRAYGATRFSHDGDIMVDYRTFGELRDKFTVESNPRLAKSQFRSASGIDVDVYVERQHKLRVPFDEIQAYAEKKNDIWVACPEHLLILKIGALHERRNTEVGVKQLLFCKIRFAGVAV